MELRAHGAHLLNTICSRPRKVPTTLLDDQLQLKVMESEQAPRKNRLNEPITKKESREGPSPEPVISSSLAGKDFNGAYVISDAISKRKSSFSFDFL